jgi:hypothetical protein
VASRPAILRTAHRELSDALAAGADAAAASLPVDARRIEIGGVTLELRFVGPAMRDALFPAVAHIECAPSGPADVTVTYWDSATSGVPEIVSPFAAGKLVSSWEVDPGGDPELRVFGVQDTKAFTVWEGQRAEAIVWVADPESLPGFELSSPARALLHWALEPHGVHMVHGASVCDRDGKGGVLMGGVGGTGKSTTAVACLERGMGFLGDDYVALAGVKAPRALSLYGTAKLEPTSVERLGGLAEAPRGKPVVEFEPPKEVVQISAYRPERVLREVPVRAIVLPSPAAEPGLHAATPGEALRALAVTSLLQIRQDGHVMLRYLGTLVRALPAFHLGLDDDLDKAVDTISGLCRSGAPAR